VIAFYDIYIFLFGIYDFVVIFDQSIYQSTESANKKSKWFLFDQSIIYQSITLPIPIPYLKLNQDLTKKANLTQ